jgi:ribosome-associated heat shock protein Hsp15
MTDVGAGTGAENGEGGTQRIDKWLWHARFFKTRSRATQAVNAGRFRVNRKPIDKAHHGVRVGDVLTFPVGNRVLVVRVLGLAPRRGPASEARQLYDDLSPPPAPRQPAAAARETGAGRPTKKQRRAIDRLLDSES